MLFHAEYLCLKICLEGNFKAAKSCWISIPFMYLTCGTGPVLFIMLIMFNIRNSSQESCQLFFLTSYIHPPCSFFFFVLWFRSFCSCLIEPVAKSPELRELVEVNLEFQVQFSPHLSWSVHVIHNEKLHFKSSWTILLQTGAWTQNITCWVCVKHDPYCYKSGNRQINWFSCS